MSDSVNSGFLTGFNLVLTCALVSIAMVLLSNGKVLTASVSTKISAVNANIQDDGLIQYDGATVKGSDVVNCIKRYSSKLDITVNKLCGSKAETATKELNEALEKIKSLEKEIIKLQTELEK